MQVFVLDGNQAVGVLGDAFEGLEWVRNLWKPHTITLDLNLRQLHASAIEKGRVLYLPDEGGLAFLIEHIETNDEPGAAKDAMRVVGRSIDAIATEERLAQPPSMQSHDTQAAVAAETAIKHYVDANAGPGAATARQVPDLAIAADLTRGGTVTVSARYQYVGDVLREVGAAAGMGWETTFDKDTGEYSFEVIPGVDRTASVFFDTAFDTLERYSELDSLLDTKSHAVVAGQGEGADREVVERFLDAEKEGLDRREVFVDARDVEPGETDALNTRGDATLESLQAAARYEATVHPYGSFRYREHWDLGDLVTLRDADRGLVAPVRVVSVRSSIADSKAAPQREVELDRPFPTLKDRLAGGLRGGAVDSPLTLPPQAHDHSDDDTGGGDQVLAARLRASGSDDVSPTSTDHPLQVGPSDGPNIAVDPNEVMARNNGAASDLHLNADGGMVAINNNSGGGSDNGLRVMNGGVRIGTTDSPTESASLSLMLGADVELFRSEANVLKMKTGDRVDQQMVGRGIRKTSTATVTSTSTWIKIANYTTSWMTGLEGGYVHNGAVQVGAAGYYLVQANARWVSAVDGKRYGLGLLIANNADPGSGTPPPYLTALQGAGSANNFYQNATWIVQLAVSDVVSLQCWQDNAVTQVIDQVELNVVRLGTL